MNYEKNRSFDLVVVGSGPGGEGAAIQAAKEGLRVAVVEKSSAVGGNCTHLGTIPSKALRHAAYQIMKIREQYPSELAKIPESLTVAELLQRSRPLIQKQVEIKTRHYQRNDIEMIRGHGRFLDAHTMEITDEGRRVDLLHAKFFVLATGSRPHRPPGIPFDGLRVFDSDQILTLNRKPKVITIYGAGVVGCEYTCILRRLGHKVNLVNTREKLLSFLDDEIIDALSYHLRDQGVLIRCNEEMESLEEKDGEMILNLKSEKKIRSDIVLFAMGRAGNSEELGLETIGVLTNEKGGVIVNDSYQSSLSHIYAVGDLIGYPSLASSAYDQGRFASRHLLNPSVKEPPLREVPVGIYTSPEISCLGKTESELTEAKVPYEVGHASFRDLARAQIISQTVGMLKILFHRETLQILGIHCFGQSASEIIHIGQAIMAQEGASNSIKYFVDTTFNYPTMAEAYRVAALNGLNRRYRQN